LQNVTFSKCHSNSGYLINVDKSIDKNKFIIDNSIFDGMIFLLKIYYKVFFDYFI